MTKKELGIYPKNKYEIWIKCRTKTKNKWYCAMCNTKVNESVALKLGHNNPDYYWICEKCFIGDKYE